MYRYIDIPFFHWLLHRSDPSTDFDARWLKRRGFDQGCTFLGFRWYGSPFWGSNSPKTPILGAWIWWYFISV